MNESNTVYMVSLGCPKNRVDSEMLLGLLAEANYQVVQQPQQATLLLINTCGFIQPAVEEAIDEILSLAALKEQQPGSRLIVTGCLVQRYGTQLMEQLPEVDLFLGIDGQHDIVKHLASTGLSGLFPAPAFLMDSSLPRLLTTPTHRAYMKVSEGCSNSCSYCLIPAIRGRQRSRTIIDLVTEATELDQAGVKELTLVGQDVTAYGVDVGAGTDLPRLIEALLEATDIPWLRLLYLYPSRVNERLLQLMANEKRLVNYLDIPLQHVADPVLKAMGRPFASRHVHQVLERIHSLVPQAAIRTTFMVGFPGETDEHVEEIAHFLRQYRLNNVGIFQYCNEEGCAAEKLPNQVSDAEKQQRYDYLMATQAPISAELNRAMVGQRLQVLVEGLSQETELLLEGRSQFQAPEIDGCIYIADGSCNQGDMVEVEITEAHPYDLVGHIVVKAEG